MQALSKQFYYGNSATAGGNVKAFLGLIDMYDARTWSSTRREPPRTTWQQRVACALRHKHVQWVWGKTASCSPVTSASRASRWHDPRVLHGSLRPDVPGLSGAPGRQPVSVVRIKKITATWPYLDRFAGRPSAGQVPRGDHARRCVHGQAIVVAVAIHPDGDQSDRPAGSVPTEVMGIAGQQHPNLRHVGITATENSPCNTAARSFVESVSRSSLPEKEIDP